MELLSSSARFMVDEKVKKQADSEGKEMTAEDVFGDSEESGDTTELDITKTEMVTEVATTPKAKTNLTVEEIKPEELGKKKTKKNGKS